MSLKRRMKRAAELGRGGPLPPRMVNGVEIVYTPVREAWYDALPPAAKAAIPRLHRILHDPEDVAGAVGTIPELEALVDRHPGAPVFYNFLKVAYSHAGEYEKQRALIARCRAVLPDYLFGLLAEAEELLDNRDYGAIPELFGGRFELHEVYPARTRFHVSEFVGFYNIIGTYHHETGNEAEARRVARMLMEVAPDELGAKALYRRVFRAEIKELLDTLNPAAIERLRNMPPPV